MRLTITDRLVSKTATEGSAIPFSVKVWTDTDEPWVAVAPTTLRYRIDDQYGCEILGWTTGTASSSQTITVTGAQNILSGCEPRQRRQFVVECDHGLSTNCIEAHEFWVRDLVGVTP